MRVASVVVLVSQSTLLTPPTPPTPLDTLDTRHSTPSTPRQHQSIPDVKIAFDTPLTPSTPSTLVSTDTPSTPPRHSVDTVDTVDTSTHQGSNTSLCRVRGGLAARQCFHCTCRATSEACLPQLCHGCSVLREFALRRDPNHAAPPSLLRCAWTAKRCPSARSPRAWTAAGDRNMPNPTIPNRPASSRCAPMAETARTAKPG